MESEDIAVKKATVMAAGLARFSKLCKRTKSIDPRNRTWNAIGRVSAQNSAGLGSSPSANASNEPSDKASDKTGEERSQTRI
jgi:hypothetical protein